MIVEDLFFNIFLTTKNIPIIVEVDIKNIYELENQDLAVIKLPKIKGMEFEVAPISNRYPAISDKVYVVGHPIGLEYTFGEGRVSNFIKHGNKEWLMVSAHAIFGNSGSPIFNDKYEVIGILSGGNGIYDKKSRQYIYLLYMTRAVKTEYLHKLLNEVIEEK